MWSSSAGTARGGDSFHDGEAIFWSGQRLYKKHVGTEPDGPSFLSTAYLSSSLGLHSIPSSVHGPPENST